MKRVEDYSSRNGTPQVQRPQMDPRTYRPDEMHAAYQRRQQEYYQRQQESYQRQYQAYQKPYMPQYENIPRSHPKNKLFVPLIIASALAVLFLFFWIFNVGHKSEPSGTQNTVPVVNAVNSEQLSPVESSEPQRIDIHLGDKLEFNNSEMTITKLQLIEANNGEPAIKLTYDWTNTGEQERAPVDGFTVFARQGKNKLDVTAYTDEINGDPGQKHLSKGETVQDAEYLVYLKDLKRPVIFGFVESFILKGRSDKLYILYIKDVNKLK